MSLPTIYLRLIHAQTNLLALITSEPASTPERWLLRLATGVTPDKLTDGKVFGPYALEELEARAQELLGRMREHGYIERHPQMDLLLQLRAPQSQQRASAAQALAWRGVTAAVEPLLELAQTANRELSAVLEALSRLGDARAIPLARAQAEKKLLSRRRAGVEALRRLGDAEGLAAARSAGMARIPENIAALLLPNKLSEHDAAEQLQHALMSIPLRQRGVVLDQLYEFGDAAAVRAVIGAFRQQFHQPHLWRYCKSVLKRAIWRGDVDSFAELSLLIERSSARGERAEVKSGLDGQSRVVRVFGIRTRRWMQRASARYLRRLGHWAPSDYLACASAVLQRYQSTDARTPKGLYGPFHNAHLLYVLMHSAGERMRLDRNLQVRFTNAVAAKAAFSDHHVAFAAHFDQAPKHYAALLARAQLPEVREFALRGLNKHPEAYTQADDADLVALLDAHADAHVPALAELQRRYPRVQLTEHITLLTLLLEGGDYARALVGHWLGSEQGGSAWQQFAEVPLLQLLRRNSPAGRSLAAEMLIQVLRQTAPELRQNVFRALLHALQQNEVLVAANASEAELEQQQRASLRDSALAQVLYAFAAESAALIELELCLRWIMEGDALRQDLAGTLLAQHPQALAILGQNRLLALAESEVQSVRAAACGLMQKAQAQGSLQDIWPLLAMAESRFEDSANCAFALIRAIPAQQLSFEALISLLDSNRTPVQAFAKDWLQVHLDPAELPRLLQCLLEHPHVPMQCYAIELLDQALAPGVAAVASASAFIRTVLMRVNFPRAARLRLMRFIRQRAAQDIEQAGVLHALLGRVLRSAQKSQFEEVVLLLSEIQQRYPKLAQGSEWQVQGAAL